MTERTQHERAMGPLRAAFEAFIRTGVWGTCVDCPRLDGKKVPELCVHAERCDHRLPARALFERYEMDLRDVPACLDGELTS